MQTNTIRIIAAVVDTHNLMLYKADGTTVEIHQGDARIRPILDRAIPLLVQEGFADISLDEIRLPNDYAQFEEASSGVVKLFRIAKSKLKGLFGNKEPAPVEPMTVGTIPQVVPVESTVDNALTSVSEILEHAIPVASEKFHERDIPQQGKVVEESGITIKSHDEAAATDTIIAVVGDQIIPGMEKIKTQFSKAASLGSTKGMEVFLQRLASVINDRKHSVEDLLKFMERGDLPIADDGSILIYKVLDRRNDKTKYVDCHTKKVEQWVGGYVCMDPSLVDHNRHNECSNGLHVARRGYVREFRGDVCVLAKVAPEDVIVVPPYDANKMRVCGYHIIAELTKEQYDLVKKNRPITDDPEGMILLAKAMAGQHIGKTHEIRITGHKGTGVQVTPLGAVEPVKKEKVAPVEAIANPEVEAKTEPVEPKDVVQKVEQLSRKEVAAKLHADYLTNKPGALDALMAYKKAAKMSWEKLGLPDLSELFKGVPVEVVVAPKKEAPKKAKKDDTRCAVSDVVSGEGSLKERIQKLLAIGVEASGVAKAVLELKKKSKKSWTVLGVSDAQVNQIIKLAQ